MEQSWDMKIYSYGLAEMCEAHIPLRFWIDGGQAEYRGETIGIAPGHFIISSPIELEDGMRLTVKLQMAISRFETEEMEIFGWVVSASLLANGKYGGQVELEGH
jgi:hypothetical protein